MAACSRISPDDIRVHRFAAPHIFARVLSNFVHQLAGIGYPLALSALLERLEQPLVPLLVAPPTTLYLVASKKPCNYRPLESRR